MKTFEKDLKKLFEQHKAQELSLEEAVRLSVLAFEKERDNPSGDPIEERRMEFKRRMEVFSDVYPVEVFSKFFTYWTGFKTPKSRKMNFEKQKTFNMGMRLKTWVENSRKFSIENTKIRREARLNYGRK